MKNLSKEEKAKRYDEALENMRKFRDALSNHEETDLWVLKKEIVTDIEYYFPELKESEDERIRKALIELFHDTVSNDEIFSDYGLDKTETLAWLEKQCEQKTTWRPSDEQMKAFEHFIRSIGESGYASPYENNTKFLYSLLEQLKKL